jgi:hypothetical protein
MPIILFRSSRASGTQCLRSFWIPAFAEMSGKSVYGCTSSVNQSVGNSWPMPPFLAFLITAAPTAAN